jgi:hypothetical protein
MNGNRAHARHDFDAPVEIVVDGALGKLLQGLKG